MWALGGVRVNGCRVVGCSFITLLVDMCDTVLVYY